MKKRLLVGTVAIALVVAACGSSDGDETTTSVAGSGDDGLSGNIFISGSSTVEPISAINATTFNEANPNVGLTVEGPGTGDGFKKFCAGETEISDASRAIKDSEAEDCAAAGVTWVELLIAIDGLSVISSNENSAISCLDFNDLYALLGPESIGFSNWSDANSLAGELSASHAPYPDAELPITAPGEESGTYDSFVELVLEDIADERGQEAETRPDYVASPNDNVIIEGIAGSDTSLGWVGYAFFLANEDRVKALEIDGGQGCVGPTADTIADGTYPIARPLYIYVNTDKAAENPALIEFVDFYLSDDGLAAVTQAGYVALASYDETRAAWAEATGG